MDINCTEMEGARLLETMRKICDVTKCNNAETATLAYEQQLQEMSIYENNNQKKVERTDYKWNWSKLQ